VAFKAKEFNVNRLRMMLIGLTILSAASARTVAQVAKDAGTGAQSVHEIQVTLRKYEFSPGSLRGSRDTSGIKTARAPLSMVTLKTF